MCFIQILLFGLFYLDFEKNGSGSEIQIVADVTLKTLCKEKKLQNEYDLC